MTRPGRRVLAFAGGRGGIGRSFLAANIGVYLAQLGKRVVLVDVDLGGASQHTILGVDPPASCITQLVDRYVDHLDELIVETSVPNLHLVAGASDRFGVANLRPTQKERLLHQFRSIDADFVLLDVGAGTSFNVIDLFLVADVGILMAVPEPTAVEAVYRFIKSAIIRLVRREIGRQTQWPRILDETVARLGGLPGPLALRDACLAEAPMLSDLIDVARQRLRPRLVINRAKLRTDFELGSAMRSLVSHNLGVATEYLGHIESDDAVWKAIRGRRPLMFDTPGADAAKDIERICRRLLMPPAAERVVADSPPPRPVEVLGHYELLEVDVGAREDEIRRGYRRICAVYQDEDLAAYGLVSPEIREAMLERAQVAYDVLLDPKSRKAYDLGLPTEPEVEPEPQPESEPAVPHPSAPRPRPPAPPRPLEFELSPDTEYTGAMLRKIREAMGVELADIMARTKVGTSYLKALEEEDYENLPALVYTRGFVGELAKYLELDHQRVVTSYIKRYKKYLEETGELD